MSPFWTNLMSVRPWLAPVVYLGLLAAEHALGWKALHFARAAGRRAPGDRADGGAEAPAGISPASVWWRRFLGEALAGGGVLWVAPWIGARGLPWLPGLLLGALVFPKVGMICDYANTLWALKQGMQVGWLWRGELAAFDPRQALLAKSRSYSIWAVLMAAGYALTAAPVLGGASLGLLIHAAITWSRAGRRPAAAQ